MLVVSCSGGEPTGPTHRYAEGSGSMELRAGTERAEQTLDHLADASYTVNGSFGFSLDGPGAGLEVRALRVRGPGQYGGNGMVVRMRFGGREYASTRGGACGLTIRRADATQADGTLSCVGLGTHAGKGYDVGARFALLA